MVAAVKGKRLPRNALTAYKGGGYDGCIWEWNYAYIDKQGRFRCLAATGVGGCRTREELCKASNGRARRCGLRWECVPALQGRWTNRLCHSRPRRRFLSA